MKAGKEILGLILNSANREILDDSSLIKAENKPMIFRLRFMVGRPSFLYAEISEDFTWLCYANDIWLKQDTGDKFARLKKLIGDIQ